MKIQLFDFSINVLESLLWRHNEAENLQALIQNKQNALDELNKDFWEDWIKDVFDLNTANDFGLSVWAKILNLPLSIDPGTATDDGSNFGFGTFRKNFNSGNFSNAVEGIMLTTDQARRGLKLRYYQLVTRGTIPEANSIAKDVASDLGNVFALDGLDMTMTYVFDFQPSSNIRLVFELDLLPRPSGVKINVVYFPNSAFGFGSNRKNFNNGNFRA